MEVTGIDGNYRLTCERVLRLLRNNNDSILAVLEAFVYDPVLNWRLTDAGGTAKRAAGGHHALPGGIGASKFWKFSPIQNYTKLIISKNRITLFDVFIIIKAKCIDY